MQVGGMGDGGGRGAANAGRRDGRWRGGSVANAGRRDGRWRRRECG